MNQVSMDALSRGWALGPGTRIAGSEHERAAFELWQREMAPTSTRRPAPARHSGLVGLIGPMLLVHRISY